MYKRIKRKLISHLRVVDYLKRHPGATNIDFGQPIFIMGCFRTGSTFLHQLLSLHPQAIGFKHWELANPILTQKSEAIITPSEYYHSANPNVYNAELGIRLLKLVSSAFFSVHDIEPQEVDECYEGFVIPFEFISFCPDLFPSTMKALDGLNNLGFIYREYRNSLCAHEHQRRRIMNKTNELDSDRLKRVDSPLTPSSNFYVFKSPIHTPMLHIFHEYFPEAKIVWTHRDMR